MLQSEIETLQAQLADAEESAVRSLKARDEAIAEMVLYRGMVIEANARNPEVSRLKQTIQGWQDSDRMARLEIANLKLEVKLLKQQNKLLKAKKAANVAPEQ